MKLLSWNIRGLGSAEKRSEVRLLVKEKVMWIVCLQETKLSAFDSSIVTSFWGNSSFNFSFHPSEGASGGLLIMWDTKEVEVWSSVSRTHFLLIHGRFVQSNEEFYLVNVYAPCGSWDKEALSVSLAAQLLLLRGKRVCVCEDCDSFKSPGPDGVNFGFLKEFWSDMKQDIMRFMTEFHRNGRLSRGINSTFIALIPKKDNPQKLNDFRPISLVGSIYKILAKVLANRLRHVIGSVIAEEQSTFVKNRQILDGILIANEMVDEAHILKKELLLFKVDFEKAYDSVDWGYLDVVMERMSFPVLWRKWIKECVSTATASVLVNGSPTDEFPLERGLRQGDPLSPFLFLIAAEGLHILMKSVVERNIFVGYTVGATASVSVTHLQFADDTLILGTRCWANVRAMRADLVLFEAISGLKVNFNKSMFVGVNVSDS